MVAARGSRTTATVLADGRIELWRPALRDRRVFLAATRTSKALHRPWVYPPTTELTYRVWLARRRAPLYECFLVWEARHDELAGYVELSRIAYGSVRSASLGYWVTAQHAGHGLMTRAVRLAVAHAFDRLRLHRIEASIQPDNVHSIALVRRLGFRNEGYSVRCIKVGGRWRDHERWAITKEEWSSSG